MRRASVGRVRGLKFERAYTNRAPYNGHITSNAVTYPSVFIYPQKMDAWMCPRSRTGPYRFANPGGARLCNIGVFRCAFACGCSLWCVFPIVGADVRAVFVAARRAPAERWERLNGVSRGGAASPPTTALRHITCWKFKFVRACGCIYLFFFSMFECLSFGLGVFWLGRFVMVGSEMWIYDFFYITISFFFFIVFLVN